MKNKEFFSHVAAILVCCGSDAYCLGNAVLCNNHCLTRVGGNGICEADTRSFWILGARGNDHRNK